MLVLAACGSAGPEPAADLPKLDITTLADGLDHPWDVAVAPDGTILTGERSGRFVALRPGVTEPQPIDADLSDLFARGETGLMGLAFAADFDTSRELFSCQGYTHGVQQDVRVVTWRVSTDWQRLERTGVLISGLPSRTGRHGGCRLILEDSDTLLIGTGDSAQPKVSQDPNSLGGKVLRVDSRTGAPAEGNPLPNSLVFTLGHRNIQGLAVQPKTGTIYTAEHGPDVDDEVNRIVPGGNYGWKPDRSGDWYDESVPMTDPDRVPGAIPAVWSSGASTIAICALTFLGTEWGNWSGAIAVAALKGQQIRLLKLSTDGKSVTAVTQLPELNGTYGRIRTVQSQPDGSLLVTTDNGGDDQILRVRPVS
ncbi:sorbosone dehydrogenase family protein [Smaragdicoccus niigatensis]